MQKKNTAIIVIHEIYGVNDHMQMICETLVTHNIHVFCPNLLRREPFGYDEEDLAYQYFIEKIGFTSAAEKISQLIKEKILYTTKYCLLDLVFEQLLHGFVARKTKLMV